MSPDTINVIESLALVAKFVVASFVAEFVIWRWVKRQTDKAYDEHMRALRDIEVIQTRRYRYMTLRSEAMDRRAEALEKKYVEVQNLLLLHGRVCPREGSTWN